MSKIRPTIGRKVWFYDSNQQEGCYNPLTPFDATIIYVWSEDLVNLRITKHSGDVITRASVPLRDPGSTPLDQHGTGHSYATWMPYQVGQGRPAGA